MKKRKLSAIKLIFLFATIGAFPLLYPGMQFQIQNTRPAFDRSFEVGLHNTARIAPSTNVLIPIDPALGPEVQPDPIE